MRVETICQVCKRLMEFEWEENEFMSLERAKGYATCDPCLKRLGRLPRGEPVRPPPDPRQVKLPYKDS